MTAPSPSSACAWATSSWPWPPAPRPRSCAYGHRGGNHPGPGPGAGNGCSSPARTTAMPWSRDTVDPAVAEVSHVNVNDGSCEGLRYARPNCFYRPVPPRGATPAPRIRNICSTALLDSHGRCQVMPKIYGHQEGPGAGLRPHRHRPGRRVRLRRHPGLPRPEGGGRWRWCWSTPTPPPS